MAGLFESKVWSHIFEEEMPSLFSRIIMCWFWCVCERDEVVDNI